MGEFVRLEVADGVGTIRLDRPQMNALNVQVQEEIRAAAAEAAERDDVRAVVVYGGEKVFAAGADVKEMADMSYADMVRRSGAPPVVVHRGRPDPQAGRRGGHRLRPRRRLRARAVRRPPVRGGQRHARPARDPARHHPRRRRHPAADRGWSGPARPRTSSSPAASSTPRRRWRIGLVDRVVPADQVYAEALRLGRPASRSAASYALRAAKEAHRPRPRGRPRDRAGDRAAAVRRPVRHRGP